MKQNFQCKPVSARIADANSVDAAITRRFSAWAFLPTPVPRDVIEHMLSVASRAASGTSTLPWRVYVVKGPRGISSSLRRALHMMRFAPILTLRRSIGIRMTTTRKNG